MNKVKLTARENACIVSEKRPEYVPNPQGLGHEIYNAMLSNRQEIAQIDVETGETYTYENLLRRCVRTCLNLMLKGITKDDIICQCSSNHLHSCVPIISAYFLGVKVAPFDPSLSLDEATYLLNQIRPRIIFVSTDALELIEEAVDDVGAECEIVVFGFCYGFIDFDQFLEPSAHETKFRPFPIDDIKQTAIVLFNGARSGASKGICLSHYALMIQIVKSASCWNFGKKIYLSNYAQERSENGFMVASSFMTFYWISAIQVLNCSILTGIAQVICRKFDPTHLWKLIDKYQISFISCAAFQAIELHKIEKPERVDGRSLRMILTSGTFLTKTNMLALRKLFPKCFITNCYDQTEAAGAITMFNFTKPGDIRDQYQNPTSCGKLMPGVSCKIVDPCNNKILGVNKAGELFYKTDCIMDGYHKLDSSDAFDCDGWLQTGVVGMYDEKHCFYIFDPLEDVFKFRHWHIVPSVIENVLKQHPAVKEAAVIRVPLENEEIDEGTMGVVSLNKGMTDRVTPKDIEKFANANLTYRQKLRGGLSIIRPLPLTQMGKPKRQLIREFILTDAP